MITGDYDQLRNIAGTHVCAEDNGRLVVAWDKDERKYYLKCGVCDKCKAVTKVMSLTQAYKAGEELPEPIKSNVEKGIRKRAARTPQAPQAETFTGVPATDLGTGELLQIEVIKALVGYAHKYKLDPGRGHVCLMYGKPYITIDGYLYHATHQKHAYSMRSFPLSEERRRYYQVNEGDHAWLCIITMGDTGMDFIGQGFVTKEEMEAKSKRDSTKLASPVVAAHPWQLAQKRAEWQALSRAFPIGEPE